MQTIWVKEIIVEVEVGSKGRDLLTKIRRSIVVHIMKMNLLIEGHLEVGDLMAEEGLVEEELVYLPINVSLVTK